jgi:hypothetical protein
LSVFGVGWGVSRKPPAKGRESDPNMAAFTVHPNNDDGYNDADEEEKQRKIGGRETQKTL